MVCQRTRFSSYLKGNVKEKERKGDWGGGGGWQTGRGGGREKGEILIYSGANCEWDYGLVRFMFPQTPCSNLRATV